MTVRIITCLGFCLLALVARGQDLSVTVTPTYNDMLRFRAQPANPELHIRTGFSTSLQYDKTRGDGFYFGPGLSYQYSHVGIAADSTQPEQIEDISANLLNLSFRLGFPLGDGYFLTADPFIAFQLNRNKPGSMEDQSGLGISAGVVKKVFLDNFFLVVEPRIWFHSLLPFSAQDPRMPLTVIGINVGLGLSDW